MLGTWCLTQEPVVACKPQHCHGHNLPSLSLLLSFPPLPLLPSSPSSSSSPSFSSSSPPPLSLLLSLPLALVGSLSCETWQAQYLQGSLVAEIFGRVKITTCVQTTLSSPSRGFQICFVLFLFISEVFNWLHRGIYSSRDNLEYSKAPVLKCNLI